MNRIKELRTEKEMKQQDLANRLKIARTVVSKYELEQVDLSTDMIRRLCEIFGCTADYLLGMSDQRTAQISDADAALLAAYHAADPDRREMVHLALRPFLSTETSSASAAASE